MLTTNLKDVFVSQWRRNKGQCILFYTLRRSRVLSPLTLYLNVDPVRHQWPPRTCDICREAFEAGGGGCCLGVGLAKSGNEGDMMYV